MTVHGATAEEIGLQLGEIARHRGDGDTSQVDVEGAALMAALCRSEVLTDDDMLAALSIAAGLLEHIPSVVEQAEPESLFGLQVSLSCLDRVISNLEWYTGTARESYTGLQQKGH